jgi:hypothetical protein
VAGDLIITDVDYIERSWIESTQIAAVVCEEPVCANLAVDVDWAGDGSLLCEEHKRPEAEWEIVAPSIDTPIKTV